mgnify:CR=1 FL=1
MRMSLFLLKMIMRKQTFNQHKIVAGICLAGILTSLSAWAESEATETRGERIERLDPFTVVGSADAVFDIPGSAAFIDGELLTRFNHDNIDQAIRRVPGVYFRTEDGFGLFPNISLRGIGSMRTSNVTVMEDGILAAPAPYSNPAAYYTPTTGRMAGIEVIKGSSQVRYGPQITGGAINYLGTPIPSSRQGYARLLYGSENEFRAHVWYGDVVETERGNVGYLAELYYRQTDGFKTIDGTVASSPSDQTGFQHFEPRVKLMWEPLTANYNRFEWMAGYTDKSADETYLGLTTDDFRASPFRRYAAIRFDVIDTEHFRTYLRHIVEVSPETRISTAAYLNDFSRSWYKLQDVNAGGGNTSLSEALASPGSAELAVLQGTAAGSFRVRNNNREYRAMGIQSFIQHQFETGEWDHELELGIRLHEDYEDRFQNQDTYTQDANGAITNIARGAPGSQDNRRGTARALALSLSDSISRDQWTFTPGIRYEHIRYTDNRRAAGTTANTNLDVLAYGSGVLYRIDERNSVFANAFRGFAVPGPGAAVGGIKEETSNAFELGYRYQRREQAFAAEAVLFWTDFNNLIVPDNQGGAGTGNTENAGSARSRGLELAINWDAGIANGWGVQTPLYLAFTYTDAELRSDANAGGGGGAAVESIFAGGRKGAKLPNVPEYQISFGGGVEWERLGLYADAVYVDSSFSTASNVTNEQRPDGTADARFGKNDSYFLLDVSARYRLNSTATVLLGANNVLDREYLASRLPHGPRPGQPRFLYAGMEFSF